MDYYCRHPCDGDCRLCASREESPERKLGALVKAVTSDSKIFSNLVSSFDQGRLQDAYGVSGLALCPVSNLVATAKPVGNDDCIICGGSYRW